MPLPSSSRVASGRAASVSFAVTPAPQSRPSAVRRRRANARIAAELAATGTSTSTSTIRRRLSSSVVAAAPSIPRADAAAPSPTSVDTGDRDADASQREGPSVDEAETFQSSSTTWAIVSALVSTLAATSSLPALAEEPLHYDPSAGSEFLRNAAGAAYVVLLVIFAFRLLRRRADFATSTRIARGGGAPSSSDDKNLTPEQRRQKFIAEQAASEAARRRGPAVRATPLRAAWGAVQAGACALLLWQVCTRVDAFFEAQQLPEGYTAHNIAVTLRTVGRGLSYLLTFIFAANAAGLGGLAVQLVFYPEPEAAEDDDEAAAAALAAPSADAFSDEDDDAAALRPLSAVPSPSSSDDEAK